MFIIQDAVKKGQLKPGGVVVEGTAGNTGIGLALVGNALGFRSVIVIPETQTGSASSPPQHASLHDGCASAARAGPARRRRSAGRYAQIRPPPI